MQGLQASRELSPVPCYLDPSQALITDILVIREPGCLRVGRNPLEVPSLFVFEEVLFFVYTISLVHGFKILVAKRE